MVKRKVVQNRGRYMTADNREERLASVSILYGASDSMRTSSILLDEGGGGSIYLTVAGHSGFMAV